MATEQPIVVLGAEDKDWVLRVWKPAAKVLGVDAGTIWYRWVTYAPANEHWIGVREVAFAQYRQRRDGVKVLYSIGVAPVAKRQGLGRRLIEHIGFPMELKTDADHAESNAFYRKLGFKFAGQKRGGAKVFNIYRWL